MRARWRGRQEGTAHPEASRGAHARVRGRTSPRKSPGLGPLGTGSQRVKGAWGALGPDPPGRAQLGRAGLPRLQEPLTGHRRPPGERGARTGAGRGAGGVEWGFLKDAHNAVGLNVR